MLKEWTLSKIICARLSRLPFLLSIVDEQTVKKLLGCCSSYIGDSVLHASGNKASKQTLVLAFLKKRVKAHAFVDKKAAIRRLLPKSSHQSYSESFQNFPSFPSKCMLPSFQ